MTLQLEPTMDRAWDHRDGLFVRAECYRYYVKQRRRFCDHMQLLDLTLVAPYCENCIQEDAFWSGGLPDITESAWQWDIAWCVSIGALKRTKTRLRKDREFCWNCKDCGRELRPWRGDDVYVVSYHLEEHYGIPLATRGRTNPPKKVCDDIIRLYDFRCFGCGRKRKPLHIDHVKPRALGGDAAFRNLQPLCEACGQRKADAEPDVVDITDDMYFRPCPSDAYEGMFW